MTFRQRQDRPATTHLATVLIRLYREMLIGGNATSSFQMLCDVTSIPRDLRTQLMAQLLNGRYVTREGDHVRITPAGTTVAISPIMPAATDTTLRPSPLDKESRVRTPGSGARPYERTRTRI